MYGVMEQVRMVSFPDKARTEPIPQCPETPESIYPHHIQVLLYFRLHWKVWIVGEYVALQSVYHGFMPEENSASVLRGPSKCLKGWTQCEVYSFLIDDMYLSSTWKLGHFQQRPSSEL